MAQLSSQQPCLTVIVTLKTTPEDQQTVCDIVTAYVDDFISQQPGFISAHVHKSLCGKRVVNYAQWQDQAAFDAFREQARSRPEVAKLLQWQPVPVFYEVIHSQEAPA